jgi:hypothetical protein
VITARAAAPVTLTDVSPKAGPKTGGDFVSLAGTGFQTGVQVQFGAVTATVFNQTPTHVIVMLPAQPTSFGSTLVQVRNPDGGIAQLPAAFNYYEPLPAGQLNSAAASTNYSEAGFERLDVFGKGTDNVLYHTFQMSGGWSGWEPLGGVLNSAPTAVAWGPRRLDVFARGTDNGLWHKWWDGTRWNGWEPLGGVLVSAPTVSSWSSGRLDVFVRGTDQGLWHKWYDGVRWNGYEPLGGTLTSDPGAASWGPRRIDVFVRGTDNGLWHKWWDGQRWLGGYEALGGVLSSAPTATSNTNGVLEVLAFSAGSTLYYLPYSNGWLGWSPEGQHWGAGNWVFGPGAAAQRFFRRGVDVFQVADDGSVWHTNLPSP